MRDKVLIYSREDGFLDRKGFFIFERPVLKIRYKDNILRVNNKSINTQNPFPVIEKIIRKLKGYSVGFFSYDLKELILNKKKIAKDEIKLPLIYINVYKNYNYKEKINYNEEEQKIFSIKYPQKEDFINIVEKAKKYIESGDVYQVNLSHRLEIEGIFYPETIFYKIAHYQPTPYLIFIKDKNFSILSASMELFLKKEGQKLITKPIKGTMKRGTSPNEDERFKNELQKNEKERSENLMITDLMRNDLARISKKGTVRVEKLFEVEKYKTLFQMSSTVTSKIREDIFLKEILYNTFPPGSVTGAPKIRAIEIIDELEKCKRNIYCGATFLIKPNLDFTMSVAIRQSIFQKNKCYIYVGAGIVYDSDPEKEYEETILKAKANIKPLTNGKNKII